jgi:hypothetical protein
MPKTGPDDRALTDLGWWGYDLRAAVPHVMVAAAVSAGLLAGRWYFEVHGWVLAVYALVLALWPGLLGVALYRAVTYTYRLTDRALLVDRGSAFPPEPPVWLADVTGVVSGASWMGRQLGVGWVLVAVADARVVWLAGVRDPGAFAIRLREAASAAARPAEVTPS